MKNVTSRFGQQQLIIISQVNKRQDFAKTRLYSYAETLQTPYAGYVNGLESLCRDELDPSKSINYMNKTPLK